MKVWGSKGYKLDKLLRVRPDTCKTVDFGELLDLFKSPDAKLLEQNEWMFD